MRSIIMMAILAGLVFMASPGSCEPVDWKPYDDGIRFAGKEKKKVFLYFRTDWCTYCAQMEAVTFKNPLVTKFLNAYFVPVKVDGDQQADVVKAYGVKGYPDNRFLDEKIKTVFRLPGFVEPMAFLFFLEYIQTDSYKTMDPMQYYKSR